MSDEFDLAPVENAFAWARAHPALFFPEGIVCVEHLGASLLEGARCLGAEEADLMRVDSWIVVGAALDWFANARFPIERNVTHFVPFPEFGVNCVRPEAVFAAFAADVVFSSQADRSMVRGTVTEDDPLFGVLDAKLDWRRVVAFRGLQA